MSRRKRITGMKNLQLVRTFGFYTRELIEAYVSGSMYPGIFPDYLKDQLVRKAVQIEAEAIIEIMLELPDLAEKITGDGNLELLVDAAMAEVSIAGITLDEFCDFLEEKCGIDLD